MWEALIGLGGFVAKEFAGWSQRRDALKQADLDAKVAKLKAQAELAAFKEKADLEWDLKWADQAGSSWKDEFMLVLWALPLIGLFIPGLRPFVMDGFRFLKEFNPDVAYWYMAGWSIIFAAVFGFKQAAALMLPGQTGKLAQVLSEIPDDIPQGVAEAAQGKISEALKKGAQGLF